MVGQETIQQILKKYPKDADIQKLCQEYTTMTQTPYYGMYVSILKQVTDWNQQITDNQIDLYGVKELKEFDRVTKYFSEMQSYADKMEYLRSKMSPQEVKEADTDAKTPYEKALQDLKILK